MTAPTRRDGQADGGPSGLSGVQARSGPEATRPFTATKGQGNPDLDVQNMDTDQYVNSLTTLITQALGPLASTMAGIQIQEVEYNSVCLVHVGASPEPICARV